MKWHDRLNFLRKLTFEKIANWIRLFVSFYFARLRRKPVQWGQPITVSIEPTTACNLRCPECPSGLRSFTRPTGNLKQDFYRKVVDEMGSQMVYLYFYFQGEPYINPEFLDMVQYAHQKGIYTVTSTNGHFLSKENARKTIESGLDRIIISIDGTTQEVYEQYRKAGKLANVLEGTRNLLEARREMNSKKPFVIFQFLVVKPNEHQIPEVYRLANELGVDQVLLKSAQIYDYQQGNPLIPSIERHARYVRQPDGSYQIKNKLKNHCWKLWHSCVITWDGKVVPCCFDKDAQYPMGNLQDQAFSSIWQSKTYQNFRSQILKGRKHIDICQNCTEGLNVWLSRPEE
jgi:radical SAM protein with 4Fe4S-binding SPASM domain